MIVSNGYKFFPKLCAQPFVIRTIYNSHYLDPSIRISPNLNDNEWFPNQKFKISKFLSIPIRIPPDAHLAFKMKKLKYFLEAMEPKILGPGSDNFVSSRHTIILLVCMTFATICCMAGFPNPLTFQNRQFIIINNILSTITSEKPLRHSGPVQVL